MSGVWRIDDEAVALSARPDSGSPDGFTVTIGERTLSVTARVAPDGSYVITMPDGERVVASVSRDAAEAGASWVTVGSRTRVLKEADLGGSDQEAAGGLEAPMPGKVLSVAVAAGDSVEAGAVLLIVEAMKMEHAIRAPSAGVVTDVHAVAGDMVSPGTSLVSFEGAEPEAGA